MIGQTTLKDCKSIFWPTMWMMQRKVCGPATYRTIRSLTAPNKPTDKSFAELIKLMSHHLTPSMIVRIFYFHLRLQRTESLKLIILLSLDACRNTATSMLRLMTCYAIDSFVASRTPRFNRGY